MVGALECGCGNIVIITSDIHSNQGLCGTIIQNGLVLRELIVGTKTISCEEWTQSTVAWIFLKGICVNGCDVIKWLLIVTKSGSVKIASKQHMFGKFRG